MRALRDDVVDGDTSGKATWRGDHELRARELHQHGVGTVVAVLVLLGAAMKAVAALDQHQQESPTLVGGLVDLDAKMRFGGGPDLLAQPFGVQGCADQCRWTDPLVLDADDQHPAFGVGQAAGLFGQGARGGSVVWVARSVDPIFSATSSLLLEIQCQALACSVVVGLGLIPSRERLVPRLTRHGCLPSMVPQGAGGC